MYLLALIFSIGYWIIYWNWIGGCLVASLLLVLFFSVFITKRERNRMELIVDLPSRIITEDNSIKMKLSLDGINFLNARRCKVRYIITSQLHSVKSKKVVRFYWGKHENPYVLIKEKMNQCDFYHIQIVDISWKDFTGLYKVSKKIDMKEDYLVMPKQYQLETMLEQKEKVRLEEEGYEYDGLRDYRPGDRLSMAHWKLYASKDELYVRKGEEEETAPMEILVNVSDIDPKRYADYFSIFYSVSSFLLKEGLVQTIYFGNSVYSLHSVEQYEDLFTRVFQEDLTKRPRMDREILGIEMNPEGQSVEDYLYDMEM